MSRKHLTSKQHSFLQYLKAYVKDNGVWPTYRELVDEFGYRSPNSVTQNLQALFKKGYLLKEDEGYQLTDVVQPGLQMQAAGIPVMGIITAGILQEAVEANLGHNPGDAFPQPRSIVCHSCEWTIHDRCGY